MAEVAKLKALTLRPHLAMLVVLGIKWIETRSWRTDHHGALAIHASATMTQAEQMVCLQPPFHGPLLEAGCWAPRPGQPNLMQLTLPRGAIIGVVNLTKKRPGKIGRRSDGAITVEGFELPPPVDQVGMGDFTPGRFAWSLSNPARLQEPVPCRGRLGLWDVPADVAERVLEGGPEWWR